MTSDSAGVLFVRFDSATGEIMCSGRCMRSALGDQTIEVLEGTDDLKAWVQDGAVVLYSQVQRAAKGRHPGFDARWCNEQMQWVDQRQLVEVTRQSDWDARVLRARLLGDSDWTQMLDSPMTADLRAAWTTYRQSLRDITVQPGWPLDITWPVQPGNAG